MHPEVVLELEDGKVESRRVKFEFASARLAFPPDVRFPKSGSLRLVFAPRDDRIAPPEVSVSLKEGDLQWPIPGLRESSDDTVLLGGLPVGSYDVNVRIIDKNGEFREVALDDGRTTWEPTPSFENTVAVELKVGEVTAIQL